MTTPLDLIDHQTKIALVRRGFRLEAMRHRLEVTNKLLALQREEIRLLHALLRTTPPPSPASRGPAPAG